jgi:hypothetical protein
VELGETSLEDRAIGKGGKLAEEAEARIGLFQELQEAPAEETREHAHRKEEAGPAGNPARALERRPAAGHNAMEVRVVMKILPPGVEHGKEADLGPEVLGIGSDGTQRIGGRAEEDVVDRGLVLEGDRRDLRRQREDDMEVWHGQQLGLPLVEPLRSCQPLALRAVAVAA